MDTELMSFIGTGVVVVGAMSLAVFLAYSVYNYFHELLTAFKDIAAYLEPEEDE